MKVCINLGSQILGKCLKDQLQNTPEITDVRIADSICESDAFHPDFAVVDAYTIKQKKKPFGFPHSKIVLLDYGLSEEAISSLILSYKIDGVMNTNADISLLIKAFQTINEGQLWVDHNKIKALIHFGENPQKTGADGLQSGKEREVIILVSQGLTNKEIASQLNVSEQTVKSHISSIFKKMNMSRRSQLVPLGMKLNKELSS